MNAKRLLKLAKHLESGKRGHAKFDYTVLRSRCGTSGCALGECPFAFPGEWTFVGGIPTVFPDPFHGVIASAEEFFDIDGDQVEFLFYSNCSSNPLPITATAKRVAKHIRKFVKQGGIYE